MSANEIIEELPKLEPEELRRVKAKVDELTEGWTLTRKPIGEVLLEFAGQAEGLPSDMAENHDYYLYGVPKHEA